jgi:acetyltransferase-like isoleucine patch superfamily enzyme
MESPIVIGNNVWIGNRTTVTPGTIIPNYCIVSSNSLCNKDYSYIPPDSIIGGIPAKLLKTGYRRIFSYEEQGEITRKLGLEPD